MTIAQAIFYYIGVFASGAAVGFATRCVIQWLIRRRK